ncbi:MAG: DUF2752 domain-containing protein [Niabella sp.]
MRGFRKYIESAIWLGALIALFLMNPANEHASLCVLKAVGIHWCPGCGIGHGIHYALHGQWAKSLEAHILGIPATVIIIYQIIKSIYTNNKKYKYEPTTTLQDVS